ncbi:MAG: nicotinate-nucleotide--dimethylbenzimidazole phosphoribosyltransferase [Candidatus Omnitrophica bacterium CG11_big_fil_rev_8_21_14_0_20_42_13]|uniref:Nicotinate-nucleotide--dimethylbenzimidazole phosphoribosyltransferase n=1 Tax=Candidatus Ghiorseimicrobium undicola TaxID=1974746 RepID=A0A2H0M2B4_9BACT|nr:MAG: nicotinate-nucleotide--dimethylbenzimidazole phosphoribosyltransferase [Candidatus Omnitrophica bacterium CG11_big_fil_rev_8_21_14_0_20_42_13]
MKKLKEVIENIPGLDADLMAKTQERLDNLTKPRGSLGKLEELAKLVVGITAKANPELKNKVIFTFAADHGVAEEGVSAFPQEVTAQMVYNFLNGGAGINVLARHVGARVVVADLGVAEDLKPHPRLIIKKINRGTKNMAKGPAMTKAEAVKSIEAGIDIFEQEFSKGVDIAGTGEMGIANTTSASAITACFTKEKIEDITGYGTGIGNIALKNKIRIIKEAMSVNKPDPNDAIDVLAKVGGFEIGALAGVILAAARRRVPVAVDGFISTAAALIASKISPKTKDYMISAHASVEAGQKAILKHMGLLPLLNLDLRLGEGTGAALGINIIEAALKILNEMATFKNAGVSEKGKS